MKNKKALIAILAVLVVVAAALLIWQPWKTAEPAQETPAATEAPAEQPAEEAKEEATEEPKEEATEEPKEEAAEQPARSPAIMIVTMLIFKILRKFFFLISVAPFHSFSVFDIKVFQYCQSLFRDLYPDFRSLF